MRKFPLFSLILQKYSHIKIKMKKILAFLVVFLLATHAFADIKLKATYIDKDGNEQTAEANASITAEAPLQVHFTSNPSSLDPEAQIEWHIRNTATGTAVTRYDENIDYTFVETGLHTITLQVRQNDIIEISESMTITISESHLEMPNAFSPNNDGINDFYQAKTNHKSIVEFHAYIFNRYGQKLYEWTDCTNERSGWDGTYHGHPVKDGVYYVYAKARGADGIEYNIKRDVNLLRNFNTLDTTNP